MATLIDKAVVESHQPQMGRQCRSVDMLMKKPEMSVGKRNEKTVNNLGLSKCWNGNGSSGRTDSWQSNLVLQFHNCILIFKPEACYEILRCVLQISSEISHFTWILHSRVVGCYCQVGGDDIHLGICLIFFSDWSRTQSMSGKLHCKRVSKDYDVLVSKAAHCNCLQIQRLLKVSDLTLINHQDKQVTNKQIITLNAGTSLANVDLVVIIYGKGDSFTLKLLAFIASLRRKEGAAILGTDSSKQINSKLQYKQQCNPKALVIKSYVLQLDQSCTNITHGLNMFTRNISFNSNGGNTMIYTSAGNKVLIMVSTFRRETCPKARITDSWWSDGRSWSSAVRGFVWLAKDFKNHINWLTF